MKTIKIFLNPISYLLTDVSFVAANGDELYAQIPTGQILPNEGKIPTIIKLSLMT